MNPGKKVTGKTGRKLRGRRSACLQAKIEPLEELELRREFGDIFYLPVRVANLGDSPLSSLDPDHPDYVSYHWHGPDGEIIDFEGLRTSLPGKVGPGGTVQVRVRVSVTVPPGESILALDMVREGETWFSQLGCDTPRIPCTVSGGAGAPTGGEGGVGEQAAGKTWAPSVEGFWGLRAGVREAGEGWGWLDNPAVLEECVFPRLGIGSGKRNWLLSLLERHGREPGGDWLSLGCGDGGFELWLAENDMADSILGVDISSAAVEIAERAAAGRDVERAGFRVLDLNNDELPADSYDVVFTSMSLHHVSRLEKAFGSICAALRPGGIFLANEYVGPSRFQFPQHQKELAESLIAVLPKELRYHPVASQEAGRVVYKDKYLYRTLEQWEEVDPSEAVRSAEILPLFKKRFDGHRVYPYGGSLLHLVLEHIAVNFDPADPKDRAMIRMMGLLESELIGSGVLESDFAVLVGER